MVIAFWATSISGFILYFLSHFFNMLIKDSLFIGSYRKEQNKKYLQYACLCFIAAIYLFSTAIIIFAFNAENIFNSLGLTNITEYTPSFKFVTVIVVIISFSIVFSMFDRIMDLLGLRIISLLVFSVAIMLGLAYTFYWLRVTF